ncbi:MULTISPECIES: hypothetical protein [Stenotrophomonas]|jgi:hypothetical protein|uniref:Uncharacterized protein n=1 Tax=Stenotrophomonas indicatrix TaxID=2045451 RepID=A0ABT8QGI4_9GAMM|nr:MULTISPECIES: hypothetical protein [Stenotrophomonas]MDN8671037.1 hypothetical protein [Stenotrophomonas indicatrix]WGV54948.1 hypothetical protein QIF44_01025 [Stenotrophomonas indicatrix]
MTHSESTWSLKRAHSVAHLQVNKASNTAIYMRITIGIRVRPSLQ